VKVVSKVIENFLVITVNQINEAPPSTNYHTRQQQRPRGDRK
jgi:hypothetical protein